MGKVPVSNVLATSDNWKCVCASNISADPPTAWSSLDPNSLEDREAWSTIGILISKSSKFIGEKHHQYIKSKIRWMLHEVTLLEAACTVAL